MNFDYKTLIADNTLLNYLNSLKRIYECDYSTYILEINLNGISFNEYDLIISKIKILKNLGFQIRLDNINNYIADVIFETTNPEYIKIANNYWNHAYNNKRLKQILTSKLKFYSEIGTIITFDVVETNNQVDLIKEIAPNSSLLSGNYYSEEKKLVLK